MRLVFFTGKGGVGKTTTSAATAFRLADQGVKTLLVSTDSAHSLSDCLQLELADEPREVADGLWAAELDAQHRLEGSWAELAHYLGDLLSDNGTDPVVAGELTVLPAMEEILALLAVRDLAERGRWDAVVVDCAATAETLRLLSLPQALTWYLEKAIPVQRRLIRGMRPMAALMGAGRSLPPDRIFAALLRLAEEITSVRDLLADRAVSTVRLVMTPESVVVAEARRTLTALSLYGFGVDTVVVNRVMTAPDGPSTVTDGWRQGWADRHADALADIRTSFAGVTVHQVGYKSGEPIGADGLREVALDLYGALDSAARIDPIAEATAPEVMRVEVDGPDFVLVVALPMARPGDVDAARSGDHLVLTVGGHRRLVALPSVLRRCTITGGAFADQSVRVRFSPDPDLWPQT